MGFLSRFLGLEKRASTARSDDPYLAQFFGMRGVGAGAVNPDNVLSAMAVGTACVSRRSQGIASVPLCIHRNIGASNAARRSHSRQKTLNYCNLASSRTKTLRASSIARPRVSALPTGRHIRTRNKRRWRSCATAFASRRAIRKRLRALPVDGCGPAIVLLSTRL